MGAKLFPITLVGSTATQIAFSYSVPPGEGYCSIEASTSDTLAPPAVDVDETIFSHANVDLDRPNTVETGTNSRTVVIGQRTSQYATVGTYAGVRHYSRALQAATNLRAA